METAAGSQATNLAGFANARVGICHSRRRIHSSLARASSLRALRLRAQPVERDYVSYDGDKSVFPAEACEELGGESCEIEGIGQEVKPKAAAAPPAPPKSDFPDRDYEEYADKKTVFPGEACDELGGEFCEPEYQKDVFPEKVPK